MMAIDYWLLFFKAFTILLVRLLARASLSDITAHAAAGIHPTTVICNKRQRIPVSILPLSIKDSHGNKIAISVMKKSLCLVRVER